MFVDIEETVLGHAAAWDDDGFSAFPWEMPHESVGPGCKWSRRESEADEGVRFACDLEVVGADEPVFVPTPRGTHAEVLTCWNCLGVQFWYILIGLALPAVAPVGKPVVSVEGGPSRAGDSNRMEGCGLRVHRFDELSEAVGDDLKAGPRDIKEPRVWLALDRRIGEVG